MTTQSNIKHNSNEIPDKPRLKSIPEVLNYLTGQGFKIGRRTLYLHKQQGILREQIGGGFTIKAVDDYARRNLDRPGIEAPAVNNFLNDDKSRLLKAQCDKIEFDNELKRGSYILKSEVEQQGAASVSFLKNDLSNFGPYITERLVELISEYIRSTGTDPGEFNLMRLLPEMLDEYDSRLDKWLGRYAKSIEPL